MRLFWLRNENRFPLACVASEFNPQNNTIAYGLSVFNPSDEFNRQRGRAVAIGRMKSALEHPYDSSPFKAIFPLHSAKPKYAIVMALATNPQVPDQVRRAAKLWLQQPERRTNDTST